MARNKVLIVSSSSVARALLSSLLDPAAYEVAVTDSLPSALRILAATVPDVAVVHADLVRASTDAIERLRAASGTNLPVVLADRAYTDDRRAAAEIAAFGAGAAIPVPTDGPTLQDAILAAGSGALRPSSVPTSSAAEVPDARSVDAQQAARYAQRLAAMIESMDAYQVLRVPRGATQVDIDAAFRRLALEYHPDRQHHLSDDTTREHLYRIFKRVSWAVRQIGEAGARAQYDAGLDARRS